MQYEIIPTLGPVTRSPQAWRALIDAGASAFRINMSHLSGKDVQLWLIELNIFEEQQPALLPVVLDLQGSKWRLGQIPTQSLEEGQPVTLMLADQSQQIGILPVPHADFFHAFTESVERIVLNDAKIDLALEKIDGDKVQARVTRGGEISSRKGITLPGSSFRMEGLSKRDNAIAYLGSTFEWPQYAISYVRDGEEMANFRRDIPAPARLIAKIERSTAVDDILRIARNCDAVWLCRGDLGAELGLAGMARAAARVCALAKELPVPLYLAGQVLEHMVNEPVPTRSEICCIHDALAAGYAGVVLSDETAIGQHPIDAVRAAAMFRRI